MMMFQYGTNGRQVPPYHDDRLAERAVHGGSGPASSPNVWERYNTGGVSVQPPMPRYHGPGGMVVSEVMQTTALSL